MPDYNFSAVEVIVVDPQPNTRRILRNALLRIGVQSIVDAEDSAALLTKAENAQPDVLILDADAPDHPAFSLVTKIRHGAMFRNPYLAIIISTWNPTNQLLTRVTNSGADDMMIKPVSVKSMEDRLQAIIEARRPFVVTSEYIGPDRRKSPREGVQIPLVEIPNTLRMKAYGLQSELDMLSAEILRANEDINKQKLTRHAFQVAFLINFAIPGLAQEPPEQMSIDHIQRVSHVIEDLLRRLKDPMIKSFADKIGRSLKEHFERLREPEARSPQQLENLRLAARGLMQAVAPDRDIARQEADVQTAIDTYRRRLVEIASAKAAAANA